MTLPDSSIAPRDYGLFLRELKDHIRQAQLRAALSVNRELIQLYWDIGRRIVDRQVKERWGAGVIKKLAKDLQKDFPGVKGFSESNIWRMRAFYLAYTPVPGILAQPVREIDGKERK